jgi:hypothetical protein
MELSWINKLRIAVVAALGIVVIGILAWPLAAPADPLLPVRAWNLGFSGTLGLLLLAFGLGFVGYFIAWPHGREIGILAVPLGLAVWAGRSGPMQASAQSFVKPPQRQMLLQSLRFEPVYWLLVVGAGFAGVLVAQYLRLRLQKSVSDVQTKSYLNANVRVNGLIAIVVTVVVAQFFIGVCTQNLALASTAAQPDTGQIIFGVIAAFAVAAFVVKKFLNLSYLWPALASIFMLAFAQAIYYNDGTVQRFAETRPATAFPHAIFTILPVQLVALGTLGSIIGYWLAVRYEYWRKHESTG